MPSRVLQRFALSVAVVVAAGFVFVTPAAAKPSHPAPRVTSSPLFNLFQGVVGLRLASNRVDCDGITNFGDQCVALNGSPTQEGEYWPLGTTDAYNFNGGLQVGATVCYNSPTCSQTGPWSGDTVGVFFMDPRGDQRQGDAVTNIFNSLNPGDLAEWPSAAYIKDTTLYNAALVGRQYISQQDTWVRYWDGNPALSTGRKHAMGVLVEQRTLDWNYPEGNQDIVYMLFRFINITSIRASDYASLADAGYSAGDIADVVGVARSFHNVAAAAYGTILPDSGYTFHNMFAAYFWDGDMGDGSHDFTSADLVFQATEETDFNFTDPLFTYPPADFSEPFYPAPGFMLVKYLKSPVNPATGKQFGISIWGDTCNGCGLLNDAVGVPQMYRYISGAINPALGDGSCNADPVSLHTCAAIQQFSDSRAFMSSGPFDLPPGHSAVIVVAHIFGAPLHKWAATTNGKYSMPAGSLDGSVGSGGQSYIGQSSEASGFNGAYTYFPGYPASPESLAVYGTKAGAEVCTHACGNYLDEAGIREPEERAAGWGEFTANTAGTEVQQDDVQTYPGSVLDKAKVAQAIFDNKFLLPFAPDAPNFYVVPGDNSVTIAWEKSTSETSGNPYYVVASNPASSLYDPDFRQIDVQGYRIWRGRTQSQMTLLAQFDYPGKSFTDYAGQVYNPSYPNCAPELGFSGANCPANFQYPVDTTVHYTYPIASPFIQIVPGGRTALASGSVYILSADTAVTGGGTGYPGLTNNGVPFTYIDNTAMDGVQYFYSVTAFSVNSLKSGPSSLQSAMITKAVTPRPNASNAQQPVLVTGVFGDNGKALDVNAPAPKIDAGTGAFTGLVPPTNGGSFQFLADVAGALPPGNIVAHIDSISAGYTGGIGSPTPNLYVSLISGADTVEQTVALNVPGFTTGATSASDFNPFTVSYPLVKYDSARAAALGLQALFQADARMPVQFSGVVAPLSVSDAGATMITQRYGGTGIPTISTYLAHAVWYDQGKAEPPQPTVNPFGSQANTDGTLTGVDVIYEPIAYRQPIAGGSYHQINVVQRGVEYATPVGFYPADFVVTWNADSSITVRDSTHEVNLPFRTDLGPGWGFVNERAYTAAGVTDADIADGTGTPTVSVVGYHQEYLLSPVCLPTWWGPAPCVPLQNKAEYEQVDYTNDGVADGSGIMLYIDGMFFIMKMSALPAAGTQWHLKAPGGIVNASCPSVPTDSASVPAACSNYSYTPFPYRPAYVPGLNYELQVKQAFNITKAAGDMSKIHTVPDPYYVTNSLETSANDKVLMFVNLPNQAIIRIYSLSGILVRVLTHNDPTGGGEEKWDLRNRDNQYVASGVYFYYVEAPDGSHKIGRLTVVNYAQ